MPHVAPVSVRLVAVAVSFGLFASGLLIGSGAATAAPVAHDPLVTLPVGSSPRSIAAGAGGEFFTANFGSNLIAAFTPDGIFEPLRSMAMPAGSHPIDVAVDSTGAVWSANIDTHSIGMFIPGSTVPTVFDLGAGVGPEAIAVGPNDVVYTANGAANTISKVERTGTGYTSTVKFVEIVGTQPVALVTDASGNIYTANANNGTVSRISAAGRIIDVFAKLPTGGHPDAIAIDSHGMLYVADTDQDRSVEAPRLEPGRHVPACRRC
jgi:streptogramin lyase